MLHPRYVVEDDLPREGDEFEEDNADFKTWYDHHERHELAKDIAAFANALGGVLLTGAKDKNEKIVAYAPRPLEQAEALRKMAYEVAAHNCVPPTKISPNVVPKNGEFVVAIHVYGSPAQPIGIAARDSDSYRFPIRVGTHTDWLKPQELATIMWAEPRTRALQLAHIPPEDRAVEIIYLGANGGPGGVERRLTLVDVEVVAPLQAHFTYRDPSSQTRDFELPIDQITTIQRFRLPNGKARWRISIKGIVAEHGGGQLYWAPTRP